MTINSIFAHMLVNWKTSSTGVLALITVAFKYFTTGIITAEDILGVLVGFGLIAAKDSNVTGGTTPNAGV